MRGDTTMTARLLGTRRLQNSYYGNPRWELMLASPYGQFPSWVGRWLTMSDAAVNYEVSNMRVDGVYVVTLSRAGRIRYMTEVE